MIVVLLIVMGLVLGSFVNAFVWRLHEGRDWVTERSECPHCHHVLAPKDLVPVLSWLWLRGKCRYCHKPIPDSPLVELSLPLLFVLSYLYWPQQLAGLGLVLFVFWLIFLVAFVALALYDFRWFLLPNKITFTLMLLAAVQLLMQVMFFGVSWRSVLFAAISAGVMSGLFLLIFVLSQGKWIGFGDVKLGLILGALDAGLLPVFLNLLVASLLGLVFSLPLIVTGKAHRKTHIPFGPFLIAGCIVVQLWGQPIIGWYSGLLLR